MAQELTHIGVLSVAKIYAVLATIFGFIQGIIVAITSSTMVRMAAEMGIKMPGNVTMGWLAIISYPIIGAITGFIIGAIIAFLYNVVAGWIGGIELEFKNK